MSLHTTEEICEALVRHLEITGSEVFEKFFVKNSRVICAVWCIIGPNAEPMREVVQEWLKANEFEID